MRIRALIVDDEPLARRRLRSLLRSEPDIDLAGECGDGRCAVAAILEKKPDLVFLDVQMPELDGFAVLDAVGAEMLPAIVFVTAYDEHALRAFEVFALDYLLKPFDRERFRKTLERVRVEIAAQRSSSSNRELLDLISELRSSSRTQQRLMVRNAGRILFIGVNEIDWIEAEGNYVRLHVGKESHLMRETMNAIEQRLAMANFQRIHRSTIVNVERVRELQPWIRGDSVVILRDNTRLTLSRNYRERFENALSRSQ